MSSTKIVIIVLVLVAVIFAIFVATGAFSSEPKRKNSNEAARDFRKNPPAWTKTIKSFIGSRQPKINLKQNSYTSDAEEKIPPDNQNPFRTAKFKLRTGVALIRYVDNTEDIPEDMEDLKDQDFRLPDFENEDPRAGSIVALKGGGTFTFRCDKNAPCRVDVEK